MPYEFASCAAAFRIGITSMIIMALCGGAYAAEPLLAGVATANITPDTTKFHVPLGGYGERQNAPATGVHDYTLAKALVLKQGPKKFALVTTDLLGIPRSLREETLKRIAETGITSDTLMLTASHSHAATEMNAMNRANTFENKAIGIFDESLLTFTADRIAEAIINANKSFQPVRAGTSSAHVQGMNGNRRKSPVVDDELTVTRIDTLDGKPFVIFVNWTAHPTFVDAKVMEVSAEWPGYLQRELEALVPGATCMYANGAEGDISPRGVDGPSAFAKAEAYGRALALKAFGLYPNIKTAENAPLDYSMTALQLPERATPPALLDAAGPEYGLTKENVGALVNAIAPTTSYLGVLRVGDLIAIGIPGEMTSSLGVQIKQALAQAGAPHPIIAGLANEWISYILPPEEYTKGGYEPGVSFYGDQLGPVIVKQAIAAGRALIAAK
ncbi:MAG: neutral/alkaline non-lysosomal ceramidase N-terminal domain-containing protein [Candidatus Hydrogenedentes bacterium]|nr:neutral/alkaline non-lysosomal ceramidase N-terminal domain-containing protein [Candidatus Hydrogenedentota bacterium]